MKLCAGIVLYNPNIKTLKKSVENVSNICDTIILVDNHSDNFLEINELSNDKKIVIIKNTKNLGIAKALNQLLNYANDLNFDYLLTLDQDSILGEKMLTNMLKYVDEKDVALICPIINDLNKTKKIMQKEEIIDLERCITSGSLMNMKFCNEIGEFDEKMFIDYVDFDYCKRIKIASKRIIRVRDAVINHEIGKRTKRKFLFWTVYPTNHTPQRIYFYSRNIKYYCKKFRDNMSQKEKINELKYLIWKFISIILYENNKKMKIKLYKQGLKDSKKM